jgi:AcrR family transcriptional regulator
VDHDERRREIADAVLRLAATEGLESVSLRHVAAEAGISMGRVQHYFRSKDEMLVFAFEHQGRRHEERIVERLRAAGRPPTVREVVRAVMVEILPTDDVSRASWLAGIAFFIRAMSDERMAAVVAAGGPGVIELFAERLGAARDAGDLAPRRASTPGTRRWSSGRSSTPRPARSSSAAAPRPRPWPPSTTTSTGSSRARRRPTGSARAP